MRLPGRRAIEQRAEARPIDAQIGHGERHVVDGGAFPARELADAVHRVVIVEGQEQPPAGGERVGFPDQLQRAGRVLREDRRVLGGEALNHSSTARRACSTRRVVVVEVGLPECGLPNTWPSAGRVIPELRFGVQTAAGVVEIHVPLRVEPAVVRRRSASRTLVPLYTG